MGRGYIIYSVDFFFTFLTDFCGRQVTPRPLAAPIFKETSELIAGTREEASLIWALFYALGLRLLEAMTAAIMMGQAIPPSRYAVGVLGNASRSIDKFKKKFRLIARFTLTQVLISRDGEAPIPDTWNFGADESHITSRRNPLCRWFWLELTRLVRFIIIIHICVIADSENIALPGRGIHQTF